MFWKWILWQGLTKGDCPSTGTFYSFHNKHDYCQEQVIFCSLDVFYGDVIKGRYDCSSGGRWRRRGVVITGERNVSFPSSYLHSPPCELDRTAGPAKCLSLGLPLEWLPLPILNRDSWNGKRALQSVPRQRFYRSPVLRKLWFKRSKTHFLHLFSSKKWAYFWNLL